MLRVELDAEEDRLTRYLRVVEKGEPIVFVRDNRRLAELRPLDDPAIPGDDPKDPYGRAAAFGWMTLPMTPEQIDEALRPMTDEEVENFLDGAY